MQCLQSEKDSLQECIQKQVSELEKLRSQLSSAQLDPDSHAEIIALRKELKAEIERFKQTENSLRGNDDSWRMRLTKAETELREVNAKLLSRNDTIRKLEREVVQLRAQLSSQTVAPALELPDSAGLLNQLKAKRKKSKADLGDVVAILEMLDP